MADFMLILHDEPATFAELSPSEMQAIVERYRAWSAKLGTGGHLRGGEKLRDEGGRHLRRRERQLLVTDGPYAEAKDIVGGFFVIAAQSYDQAAALCADCPHLDYGWIELREIERT